jgi:acyl carrier protein phosphodiesterase
MSKVAIENRTAYREANFPAYLQYAASQEAKIKGTYPEEYQAFLNTREESRQWLEKMPNGFLKTKMIEAFDREEPRLKDFANFFHDLVGDFWEWDKKYNQEHQLV